jgi:hypothetical protein
MFTISSTSLLKITHIKDIIIQLFNKDVLLCLMFEVSANRYASQKRTLCDQVTELNILLFKQSASQPVSSSVNCRFTD